jgi:tetratricopeptide (TPR) repeat protein
MDTSKEARPDPPYYPRGGTYADFLAWHLFYWGTRADGDTAFNGQPWKKSDFVSAVFGAKDAAGGRVGLRNWLAEAKPPNSSPNDMNHRLIKSALFGTNAKFKDWGEDLDQACERSTLGRNRRTKNFPDPPPIPLPIQATTASIPRLTPFFLGRDDDVERLAEIFATSDDGCDILIQGGPGIGKTELTKAIANDPRMIERFSERRFFVRLEITSTAATMQDAILRAAGCDCKLDLQSAFRSQDSKQTLLILDNLEKPWEAIEERAETETILKGLSEIPGVSVMASFRGFDFVDGPTWHPVKLNAFLPQTSKTLFSAIAGQWVTIDPCFDNFIAALGGIPLAVDLVARRAYGRTSLKPLWREWEKIGADFAKRPDFSEGAITSLPYSIELSLKSPRLSKETGALRLFGFLGCLPAGLSDHDCQSLMSEIAYRAEECLFNAGLAIHEMERINLLPPIREHAKRYYPLDSKDSRLWVEFFLQKTLTFYKSIDKLNGKNYALDSFFDINNINSAMAEAVSSELEIYIFDYLESYLVMAICLEYRIDHVIEQMKKNGSILSVDKLAYLEFMDAFMLFNQGELVQAYGLSKKNYFDFREVDNKIGMARCCWLGGTILSALDEDIDAVRAFEEALEYFTELSDVMGQTSIEITLISAFSQVGRFDEANELVEKHIVSSNKNETFYELLINMQYHAARGDFEFCRKNHSPALEYYKKAIDLANYVGAIKIELRFLFMICELCESIEQTDLIPIYAERALKLCNSLGYMGAAKEIQDTFLKG